MTYTKHWHVTQPDSTWKDSYTIVCEIKELKPLGRVLCDFPRELVEDEFFWAGLHLEGTIAQINRKMDQMLAEYRASL